MSGTLTQHKGGYWTYNEKGPGGKIEVICSEFGHNEMCRVLLGRFHFHGTFTPKSRRAKVRFFSEKEGNNYPADVLEELRGEPQAPFTIDIYRDEAS